MKNSLKHLWKMHFVTSELWRKIIIIEKKNSRTLIVTKFSMEWAWGAVSFGTAVSNGLDVYHTDDTRMYMGSSVEHCHRQTKASKSARYWQMHSENQNSPTPDVNTPCSLITSSFPGQSTRNCTSFSGLPLKSAVHQQVMSLSRLLSIYVKVLLELYEKLLASHASRGLGVTSNYYLYPKKGNSTIEVH